MFSQAMELLMLMLMLLWDYGVGYCLLVCG
jgi:hypothetical protein